MPRLPENGDATGSVWAEGPRRPTFAWESSPGVTCEIEVDDSCPPTNFQSCEFPSPEWAARRVSEGQATPDDPLPVAESAPVGRRYFWRVRACTESECSLWSTVRYVDVGRQRSDFDGDGYSDVVLANQGSTSARGRVLVAFGPVPSSRTVVARDLLATASQDRFGFVAEPLGDMDADGFADLLITASGNAGIYGQAFVYFGSQSFSEPSTHIVLRVSGDVPGDGFGEVARAVGDIDADGFQDFVAGNGSVEIPTLRLLRGFTRAVIASDVPVTRPREPTAALSAGDVTGDGYADVLSVSVLSDANYRARYELLEGGIHGLGEPRLLEQREGYPVAAHTILSDVNHDGFRDMGFAFNVLGQPDQARIRVSLGGEEPPLEPAISWQSGLVPVDGAALAELNGPIAAGDVNGDGYDDGLVAVSWHGSRRRQANLYLGNHGSREGPDAVYLTEGEVMFVSTGLPSAVGDVNGDGFDDVWMKDDYSFTGTLFLGNAALDTVADDVVSLPVE